MEYRFLSKKDDECFIEITRDTFRTKIEFDFTPDENFKGIAVCCSYSFKGHPLGFLKDNGLNVTKVDGYKQRPIFEIDETIIQAGPSFIRDSEPFKDYLSEGFDQRMILSGFHAHIGKKASGNIIIGYTKNSTFVEMVNKYADLNAVEAIKLPGFDKGAFIFSSKVQTIQEGVFPAPAALIFEPRLNEIGHFLREIS